MISLQQHTMAQPAPSAAWEAGYEAGYAAGLDDAPAPVEVEMMAEEEMVEYLWSAGYVVAAPRRVSITGTEAVELLEAAVQREEEGEHKALDGMRAPI